ncbi:Sporulation and spore germination [Natronincola peptidivorans]|uniref:Sporulation and spore germination n=1 Tax=Natronincola peptidivorans TaxID=426128 RepID=A0A1H9ZQ87_9FIRM|nr:GerMN domain-containing protein [Natronincola peptidivorans]SES83941.1 Sporulation and spore germination [Natronincola peptidivorans]
MKKIGLKLGLILLAVSLILTFVGCNRAPQEAPAPLTETENPQNGEDVVIDPAPEGEEIVVTLYFANYDYIMTGDQGLESTIPVEKTITVGERGIEEIIIAELQSQPEEEELSTTLDTLKVLSVDTAEKIVYVNFSSEQLSGGTLQESLVLQQVVYSLTELPEIEAVQILVDGSKRETLMGHIFIEEPLIREDIGF